MKYKLTISFMIVFLVCIGAAADRGSIPFTPGVQIFEPNQRAIIAWTGTIEVLILTTDLYASDATRVLEVIPVPSEPVVELGEFECFDRALEIINNNISFSGRGKSRSATESMNSVSAGEITFHKRLGQHDVSIARVLDSDYFSEWVMNYLSEQGVEKAVIPEGLTNIIKKYLSEDYEWFAFDVVDIGTEKGSLKPLKYTFPSEKLYYPLKITSMEKGNTQLDVIVITPELLKEFPSLPIEKVRLMHQPFAINHSEISYIDSSFGKLFKPEDPNYLRIWRCEGDISSFSEYDLIAY